MDNVFAQYQQRYLQLSSLRGTGQLSPQQFVAEVQKLRWQDSRKIWWTITTEGVFRRYDGKSWIPVDTSQLIPSQPQAPAQPSPMPVQQTVQHGYATSPKPAQISHKPQSKKSSISSLVATFPFLAIIPSFLCGSLWFLYTFIGVFKYEGIGGIDFVTPLIMVGLPLIFLVLKKPIDQLLNPFKTYIQVIPKPFRLGICLAVPIFLACGCSSLSSSGYLALNISTFVSIMTAAVLMRY